MVASADELWADPGALDLVVVAAPNRAHVPLARAAIAAGIATVVDKPLAPTAAEGRALAEEARAAGVALSVFHNRRWDGDFLTLRRLLAEGALGAAGPPGVALRALAAGGRPEPLARAARPGGGRRAARRPGQPPHRPGDRPVRAPGRRGGGARRAPPGRPVDDDVFVALAHPGGERSHLLGEHAGADDPPRLRAVGLGGVYVKHGLDPQEAALRDGARPGPGWGAEPEGAWGRLHDGSGSRVVPTEAGDYPAFYAGMARTLARGRPPPVAPEEAVAVLEVIEEARRAAAARRPGLVTSWQSLHSLPP